MKIAFLLLACLPLALAPVSAETTRPPEAATEGPRIAVDPPSFDFGKALPQKPLSRVFSIRNFGQDDLVIENVSTSCGCTVTDHPAKVVKPGGSTPLKVTLTTPQNAGRLSKSVMVRSNDPVRPVFEIKLQATVVAETP